MAHYETLARLARAHGNTAAATPDGAAVQLVLVDLDGRVEVETVMVRTLAELLAVLGY